MAKAPFLAYSFLSPFVNYFVGLIVDVLYDKGALAVNWVWIAVESHLELKAVIKTKDKLRAILDAGGDYTKAEKEFDDATDDLIHHRFGRLPR